MVVVLWGRRGVKGRARLLEGRRGRCSWRSGLDNEYITTEMSIFPFEILETRKRAVRISW